MSTKAELLKAVRQMKRADVEFQRARDALEQPRLAQAGTAYMLSKFTLYKVAGLKP